ncbi:MAG: glycyl-radical enzyme activating protein [Clostridiales bacterium]|nr:MAG: glycyl-radical enzyme activating protein [Clostridiales bacterium]
MKDSKGIVTEIQRWSLNDGDGIRTTVFLKGCPLRCAWCHNPETHAMNPELTYKRDACVSCGKCVEVCPQNALRLSDKGVLVERRFCDACGVCVEGCKNKALSITGRIMTTEEVMDIIEKDSVFYRVSGGGVTFSGGEPTIQREFMESLLDDCQAMGIDTAIETAMHFRWEDVEPILGKVDMIFADIKHMDSPQHEKWTGVGNEAILENLKRASALGKEIVVRIPLVEGINDTDKNIRDTVDFINDNLSVKGVELLPYHNLARDKYESLNKSFAEGLRRPSKERMEEIKKAFSMSGIKTVSFA